MDKTIFQKDYSLFLSHLRAARKEAGLTQIEVATRLRQTQSFVSKCERGERRIDIVELRAFCRAIGVPLAQFVRQFELELEQGGNDDEPGGTNHRD
jgi:transcriptional regulator with XRE-family HTH domain